MKTTQAFIRTWGLGLRAVSGYLDQLHLLWDEFPPLFKDGPQHAQRAALLKDMTWFGWYELPGKAAVPLMLAVMTPAIALQALVVHFPALRAIVEIGGDSSGRFLWRRLNTKAFAPAVFALNRTLQCFLIHQQTVNALVARVRSKDDLDAFFNAVGIDPTVLSAKPMRARLARAVFEQDQPFLTHLANTLKSPPKREDTRETARLNASMALMASVGQLDKIKSADMAYEIFVTLGRVYKSENANISARGNLWTLVRKAQKQHRKIKRDQNSS